MNLTLTSTAAKTPSSDSRALSSSSNVPSLFYIGRTPHDQLDKWRELLGEETCQNIERIGASEALAREEDYFPSRENILRALHLTAPENVKVIILGQDPYHEPGQAMGLAFSVPEGTKLPPSLRNIFIELENDTGYAHSGSDLTPWAQQGVLLLNTVLTVPCGQANGHKKLGWEKVSSAIVDACSQQAQTQNRHICVLCWGKQALNYVHALPSSKLPCIHILASTHPSPLSARRSTKDLPAFLGSCPFSSANHVLQTYKEEPINWACV